MASQSPSSVRSAAFRRSASSFENAISTGLISGLQGGAVPVFALPLRPVETGPLNFAGWQVRNAAKTGPNRGDVTAPLRLRAFLVGVPAEPGVSAEALLPWPAAGFDGRESPPMDDAQD